MHLYRIVFVLHIDFCHLFLCIRQKIVHFSNPFRIFTSNMISGDMINRILFMNGQDNEILKNIRTNRATGTCSLVSDVSIHRRHFYYIFDGDDAYDRVGDRRKIDFFWMRLFESYPSKNHPKVLFSVN